MTLQLLSTYNNQDVTKIVTTKGDYVMNKINFKNVKLAKGEMNIYDFGAVKLHAYKTNDLIDDEVFVLEKGGRLVVIESPCFFDNITELEQYINGLGAVVDGVMISYHAAGSTFLKSAQKFATKNADDYGHKGGGKALIDNFTQAFGSSFDNSIHTTTDFLENGRVNIGGITFEIVDTNEGYDIIIPEINAVYTHMLGHDCHSIVAGSAHADAIIATLKEYITRGYDLVLTSHYTPEDLKDVETKIEYLEQLKKIADECKDAEEFKGKVAQMYPNYSGTNYLDMTAEFFFPK